MKARDSPSASTNSTVRLAQMDSPYSTRSMGNTPNPYQMSSLNPSAIPRPGTAAIPTTKEQILEEKFQNLEVVKVVGQLEAKLGELSAKVSSFTSEDLDTNVQAIIDTDEKLWQQINLLEEHQRLGKVIGELEEESKSLDDTAKTILKKLIGFRAELKSLPRLPTKQKDNNDLIKELDVDEVLKYGMKLAKFTKVPPTAVPTHPHPNNFVWPAEDSLRRGMLALSSLKEKEILEREVGSSEIQPPAAPGPAVQSEAAEAPEESQEESAEPQHDERRSTRTRKKTEKAEEVASSLNLDLFDPENEDDSD